MIPKLKTCSQCGEEKVIWKAHEGKKYCQHCWNYQKYSTEEFKPTTSKPIAAKSKKMEELDKAYSKLRTIFLTKNPMCQAALPGCRHQAGEIHHKKGRGKWYLVVSTWMAVCRPCHMWIHEHPEEATELGFRESKITDNEK